MRKITFHISLTLLLTVLQIHAAQAANCDQNINANSVTVEYSQIDRSKTRAPSTYSFNGIASTIEWRGQLWHVSHQYLAFDFPANEPDAPTTNGDLHTLSAGRPGFVSLNNNNTLTWDLSPTLAVSSNQLKHTDNLQASGLYLAGELSWKTRITNRSEFLLGICLDTLSGEYEPVPVLGYHYAGNRVEVHIGYPNSELAYKAGQATVLLLSWSVSGGDWEILDANQENRSDFSYSNKQLGIGVWYSITPTMRIHTQWTSRYDQEMEYLAQNGDQMAVESEDSSAVLLGFSLSI